MNGILLKRWNRSLGKRRREWKCYQSTGIMIDRQIITSHDKHEFIDWLFILGIIYSDFHAIQSMKTVYVNTCPIYN